MKFGIKVSFITNMCTKFQLVGYNNRSIASSNKTINFFFFFSNFMNYSTGCFGNTTNILAPEQTFYSFSLLSYRVCPNPGKHTDVLDIFKYGKK